MSHPGGAVNQRRKRRGCDVYEADCPRANGKREQGAEGDQ